MKNCMKYFLLLCLSIFVMPMAAQAAENDSFKIEKDKVSVSLNLPEGKTETITSLRMQILVTAKSGSMGEPGFVFDDAIKSTVKDVSISNLGADGYSVDVILSGKKDQDIFADSEYVKLGDLSLQPTSEKYEIKIEIAGDKDAEGKPAISCVDAGGVSAMTVSLTDAEPLLLTEANYPEKAPKPDYSAFKKKMKLSTSVETGKKRVTFTWEKVKGAEGYLLYQYDAKTKKYTLLKKILGADTTTYSKNYAYGTKHSFKIRAFRTESDGSMKYGKYSPVVKAEVVLAKVTGISPEYQSKSKVSLSWKKVSGAKGYQIYRSSTKNGKYKKIKTVKGAGTQNCSNIKHADGAVYYYKIRAYTTGTGGQRVYGSYSAVKPAFPKAPGLRVKKVSSKKVTLTWKKVARADGYYVYRSSKKSGKYVRIKTINQAGGTSYTSKAPAGKYYYKVCAFEKQNGKKQKGADSLAVKAK